MSDDVDLRLMDPFYRIRFDDGRIFDYSSEKSENLRQINEYNPADAGAMSAISRRAKPATR